MLGCYQMLNRALSGLVFSRLTPPTGRDMYPKNGHAYKTWVLLSPPHRLFVSSTNRREGRIKEQGETMVHRASEWLASLPGSKGGAVVRALASPHCGPRSNPGVDAMCGLSLWLVLCLAPRGFSPGTPVFPSPQKPTLPNSNSIRNARTRLNEFIWTLKCFVGKKAIYNFFFFP